MRLVNGGHVHRTFLNIEDASAAFQLLLDQPEKTRCEIYNIGNPANNITIREFALLMREIYTSLTNAPALSALEEIDGEAFYGVGYEDGDRLPPDVTKMRQLGWKPRHDLRSTLTQTMQYYLDHQAGAIGEPARLVARLWEPVASAPPVTVPGASR